LLYQSFLDEKLCGLRNIFDKGRQISANLIAATNVEKRKSTIIARPTVIHAAHFRGFLARRRQSDRRHKKSSDELSRNEDFSTSLFPLADLVKLTAIIRYSRHAAP
jgi:hypothetical protein